MMQSEIDPLVGPVEAMSVSGNSLFIPAQADTVERIATAVRSTLEASGALGEAVDEIEVDDAEVRVTFRKPLEPSDLLLQGRLVKCHLFDPQVMDPLTSPSSPPQEDDQTRSDDPVTN